MNPETWGPPAWAFMHCVTLSYPITPTKEDKEYMKNFFNSLPGILPCYKCRMNFNNHLSTLPLTDNVLSSKETLVKWLIDVHNAVNKTNGKKIMSYEEAINCCYLNRKTNNYYYLILLVLFILIIFYFFKK